jgi:hypothetical protein
MKTARMAEAIPKYVASRMTRTMISPRQRSRSDSQAPVLFRLPNLHRHESSGNSFISSQATEVPAPPFDRVEKALNEPAKDDSLPQPTPVPSQDHQPASAIDEPHTSFNARSWMERIGSRLILVITLLIITSAAWITGARRPAENTAGWSEQDLSQKASTSITESSDATNSRPDETEIVITEILTNQSKDDPFPSEKMVDGEADVVVALSPPTNTHGEILSSPVPQLPDSPSVDLLEDVDPASIFNTVSTQSPRQGDHQPADNPAFESLTLEPPQSASAHSTTENTENAAAQTATPNAPVIDPTVLLPWLSEKTSALNHRQSATPNGIEDWSKYMPAQPGNPSPVRAASAVTSPYVGGLIEQAGAPTAGFTDPFQR